MNKPHRPTGNAIHEVFPYLCVKDAAAAADFYRKAFGASERFRLTEPGGRIGHLELNLGNTILMLSDEYPEIGALGPDPNGSSGVVIHLHVDDANEMAARAYDAGAAIVREPEDQFYGERSCLVQDPFGHRWLLGHSIEEVSEEEMQRRLTAMFDQT